MLQSSRVWFLSGETSTTVCPGLVKCWCSRSLITGMDLTLNGRTSFSPSKTYLWYPLAREDFLSIPDREILSSMSFCYRLASHSFTDRCSDVYFFYLIANFFKYLVHLRGNPRNLVIIYDYLQELLSRVNILTPRSPQNNPRIS